MQLQKGQPIQLATNGSAPEFPEGPAKDSQLLLSATFLTAELALLQKSLEVKLKDKRVSCHHTPLASAPRVPGSTCPGHLGVVQESDAGDVGLLGVSMAVTPAYHSLLCPCDLCLSTCLSNLPYTLHFFSSKLKKKCVQCRGQKTTFWSWFSPSTGGSRAWDQVKACAARDFTC